MVLPVEKRPADEDKMHFWLKGATVEKAGVNQIFIHEHFDELREQMKQRGKTHNDKDHIYVA